MNVILIFFYEYFCFIFSLDVAILVLILITSLQELPQKIYNVTKPPPSLFLLSISFNFYQSFSYDASYCGYLTSYGMVVAFPTVF